MRRELPQVKSGHLTEALATGLGFQTHASLLATIKSALPAKPKLAELNLQRITARLAELNWPRLAVDFLNSNFGALNLPDRLWFEFRNGNRGANEVWYRECEDRNIPMIFLEKRQKYIRLNWDCITLQTKDEAHVRGERGRELVHKMMRTFQAATKGARGKPFFDGTSFDGCVDNLLPELAHKLADEYFALLYGPASPQT